jgi:hypothetical protein
VRGDPPCLLRDGGEQMDNQLTHDEQGLCPTGGIQRKPFWQWDPGSHHTPLVSHHWQLDLQPGAV